MLVWECVCDGTIVGVYGIMCIWWTNGIRCVGCVVNGGHCSHYGSMVWCGIL